MLRIDLTTVSVFTLVLVTLVAYGSGTRLILHRASPPNWSLHLKTIISRDRARHAHLLGDFRLSGGITVSAMYYTTVSLGTPSQKFNIMVDTGSQLPWVSCANCTMCNDQTSLDVKLNYFDIDKSTTGVRMSCKDYKKCSSCSDIGVCNYSVNYDDGSVTSGYMVSDVISLHSSSDSRVPFHFGCSTSQMLFGAADTHVDGVFGFGRGDDSVVQQISSQGATPKVFSHCFRGGDSGGGELVLGEALHPDMAYTPLVQSRDYYSIKLEAVAVNKKSLKVSSAIFNNARKSNIVVDSGTTLTYLNSEIYEALVNSISGLVSDKVKSYLSITGKLCYFVTNRENEIFPQVSFQFSGGALMVLRPQDYLTNTTVDGSHEICMGFQTVEEGGSQVLGEISLTDKIVVYDLYRKRLGWSSTSNCSLHMDVDRQYGFSNGGNTSNVRHHRLWPAATILSVLTAYLL